MASRGEVERWLGTPRLLDWLEHEFPLFPSLHPYDVERLMRCEEYVEDDRFVVRAELPGVDPDKDVEVTVADGVLRIQAVRREEKKEKSRSEFFYGELARTLTLPKGTDAAALTATYKDGVLEVSAPIKVEDSGGTGTKIPVKRTK